VNIKSIQINHQLDATISPVYYLTFIFNSTCFGRPHAHHQELNNCSSSLWFYLRSVVIAVLSVVVGPIDREEGAFTQKHVGDTPLIFTEMKRHGEVDVAFRTFENAPKNWA
jgi:hypothetical protein